MNGINWFKGGNTPPSGGGETRRSNALRVFIVVAALHAVVLGPILLFEGCKSGSNNSQASVGENTDPVPPPQEVIAAPVQPLPPAPAIQPPAAVAELIPTAPVPTAPSPISVPPTTTAKTYKVQSGDSLWKIAKTERVTIADLMRANNLSDKSVLRVGQTLQIPATTVASERPASNAPAAPIPAGGSEYVVQSGDSLWLIARKNNTTVNALKEVNRLTTTTLRVGQKLVIPVGGPASAPSASVAPQVDPLTGGVFRDGDKTYHYVGYNEALENIAKRYGVAQKDIIQVNKLQNASAIRVGDKLLIPIKAQAPVPAPATPEAAVPPPPPLG